MVATVNSSGEVKSSSQCASGNACARVRFIRRARRTKPTWVSTVADDLERPDDFAAFTYDRVLIS